MKNWKRYALAVLCVALAVGLAVTLWQVSRPASPQPEAPTSEPLQCALSVRCDVLLRNTDALDEAKAQLVPENGVLLEEDAVAFTEGESAFTLLKRVCQERGLHLDFSLTPGTGMAYIKGIGNLYELDCGERSGWLYRVNGQSPDVACSDYTLQSGDRVEFLYSCDWGNDLP